MGDSSYTTQTATTAPVIAARHVHKIFARDARGIARRLAAGEDVDFDRIGGTAAVVDANFEIHAGEIFVVMGLSGSGKSTLLRTLNGLNPATYGSVEIDGTDITAVDATTLRRIRREKIAMVFQHFALMPHRSVRSNVAYGLEVRGMAKGQRLEQADHWLDVVDLKGWGDKLPQQLSGGMQQRVGLARALAAETPILLMDEAFSALDPLIRTDLQAQMMELQADLGKTIVFITHDLNEAMRMGDRIAIMRSGRIVQLGSGPQILTEPADDYVRRFVQDVDRSRVLFAGQIAQEPDHYVSLEADAGTALEILDVDRATASLVLDQDRRPVGLVRRDELAAGRSVREGLVTDAVPFIPANTLVADLFAPAARTEIRLPIVGTDGRLLGMVGQDTLLEAMDTGDTAAPKGEAA